MCSRYELNTPPERMIERFGLRVPDAVVGAWTPQTFARGEIRPTNLAPTILPDGELAMLPWGLSVSWQSQPLINARSETLDSKPTFKPLIEHRCLVPASAYFEWRKDGKSKIKTRIALADASLMSIAGLTDGERFTIVTCVPAQPIAHIHNRMPVVLDHAAAGTWLDRRYKFADVKLLLAPFAGALGWSEPETRESDRQASLFG